ncbi:MAG: hypothetical protein J0M05_10760 [Candidatus Kapabacteria bacterium]|nr:hypothetical protein [Candidatus Kapabacteria bacterium]
MKKFIKICLYIWLGFFILALLVLWFSTSLTDQTADKKQVEDTSAKLITPKIVEIDSTPKTAETNEEVVYRAPVSLRTEKMADGSYNLVLQNSTSKKIRSVTVEIHDFTGHYMGEMREHIDTAVFENVGSAFESILVNKKHYIGKIERSNIYGNVIDVKYK